MANKKTSEEVREDHLEGLGPELGPTFNALYDELSGLQLKWGEYRELFGTSEERVHFLNSAAGLFFGMLQQVLWDDTLLHLCRLTDRGKSRLTIRALPKLCQGQSLRGEVSDLVEAAVRATEFARDPRNRIIAHHNLELALEQGAKPLSKGSRENVSAALRAIHTILNHISDTLLKTSLGDRVLPPRTGASALLQVLKDGLAARGLN